MTFRSICLIITSMFFSVFFILASIKPVYSLAADPFTGRQLYYSYCSVCHGKDGKGSGPLAEKLEMELPDLTGDDYQMKSNAELVESISGYKIDTDYTTMPKWTEIIPEQSIRDIAAYIAMLTLKEIRLIGNLERGKNIYIKSCAACHGPRGKGKGILARHLQIKNMGDLTTKSTLKKKSDETVLRVIRDGNSDIDRYMPGWHGILSNDDIYNVAAYVISLRE